MVVFSCDGCGEMLKKSQVDAHASRCRRCDSVSCVDCSHSFYGDDFRSHTTCISEAERYEKSLYKGKNSKKQKQTPQEAWMELIVASAHEAPREIRQYMEALATLENVPRKPKQFRNFTANSLNLRGKHACETVEAIWKYLSDLRERQQAKQRESQDMLTSLGDKSLPEPPDQKQEQKDSQEQTGSNNDLVTLINRDGQNGTETSVDNSAEQLSSRTIRKAVRKILKKAPNRSMKVKSLRRAVRDSLNLDKARRRKLKVVLSRELDAYAERIQVDGKLVKLL